MPRDNLLNSACLELFEAVRRDNVKPIILHLVEHCRDRLEAITYVDTFRGIVERYNALMQPEQGSSFMTSDSDTPNTRHVVLNGGGTRWQGLKDTDADEEAYFNTSDGDDNDEEAELSASNDTTRTKPAASRPTNGASPLSKPLVDYVDDDDDDTDEFDAEAHMEELKKNKQPSAVTDSVQSSPPTPSPASSSHPHPEATSPTQSSPLSYPPSYLSEKRRRADDDDDDELSRLASAGPAGIANGPKRRLSSNAASERSVASDASWDVASGASDSGAENGTTPMDMADGERAAPRQSLRRKKAFGLFKDGVGQGGKKIAFTLSNGGNSGENGSGK